GLVRRRGRAGVRVCADGACCAGSGRVARVVGTARPPGPANGSLARAMARSPRATFPTVRAMLLDSPGRPLRLADVPEPEPGPGQIRIRVHACGVCRTDLHLRDGEVEPGHLPL